MRLPMVVALAALALPATAHAGTIGLEAAELVYRSDPGEADDLLINQGDDGLTVKALSGSRLRLGAGCKAGELGDVCPTAGVSGLTILAGDRADLVQAFAQLPLTVDLGDGNDTFDVSAAPRATVDTGPGNDSGVVVADAANILLGDGDDGLELEGYDRSSGPYTVDGGPGDDEISLRHRGPGMTLSGGAGNDRLSATAQGPAPVAFVCGPGADRWVAYPRDTPGDGCAAHLAPITTKTVSRRFREGALTAHAAGSVTLKRREGKSGFGKETVARGTFSAGPGPLRLTLKTRGRFRPRLPVFVTILTRTSADRGEVSFYSKVR